MIFHGLMYSSIALSIEMEWKGGMWLQSCVRGAARVRMVRHRILLWLSISKQIVLSVSLSTRGSSYFS
jgi:hypothetical protein